MGKLSVVEKVLVGSLLAAAIGVLVMPSDAFNTLLGYFHTQTACPLVRNYQNYTIRH